MSKRLEKRHKRQVSRAKKRATVSEPDLRTPEEIRAARELSRPAGVRGKGALPHYSTPPSQPHSGGSTAKVGN
jgi:hypothetical protein